MRPVLIEFVMACIFGAIACGLLFVAMSGVDAGAGIVSALGGLVSAVLAIGYFLDAHSSGR